MGARSVRGVGRSSVAALAVAMAVALVALGCTSDDSSRPEREGSTKEGTTTDDDRRSGYRERAADYLATAVDLDVADAGSRDKVWHAVAVLAADPDGSEPVELTVDDLSTITERFATFQDTTDFDMVALINLWYRSGKGERLAPATRDHVRELILGFKYWYDEPQPAGIVDERWYWSENHQILFHTIELLAGQAFPDETFTNDGTTGADHMAHAEPLVRRWVDERARFGFSEWYSNVYYQEDLEATVALAEFADDDELATLGAIATDLALYDMASHTHQGAFGATHGRSYKKDKMTALDEDTWDVSKLVLDDTDLPYRSELGAVFLASASRYRPPAVVGEVVADDGPAGEPGAPGGAVERARHSLDIDPLAPVTADAGGPMGLRFDDPENLMLWWGMGALTPWQTVVQTTNEMTKYDLWKTELFSDFRPFEPLVKAASPDTVRALARSLAPQLNIGLLSTANTYTWRSDGAMLSTVQDFRKGQASQQHHVWQATLSPDAQVFTTHPRTPTEPGVPWHENSEDWTGNASLPRSAQVGDVNISIYAPLFPSEDTLQGSYQPYTHAYLPLDHVDENWNVVAPDGGNWTVVRAGDEYLALYSWRPARWATYGSDTDTNGLKQPFELVADGGPNNVWICQLGSRAVNGPFELFRDGFSTNGPKVTPLGDPADPTTGFDVEWTSPTQGTLSFGWDRPLVADGAEVPLAEYPRIDSPWAQVPFDSRSYRIEAGGETLELDVEGPSRRSSADL